MIRVQMVGTQRSGSNLLRLMLDQGGSLLAPPSAHELRDLLPLAPLYEPLDDVGNQRRLASDLSELVRANALAWPDGHVDADRLLGCLKGTGLTDFVIALYDQAATHAARIGWVSKCLENVHCFEELEATGASPRYVHLVRDPRDVALSFRRAPIGPKDPRVIAAMWRNDQQAARAIARRCPERTRVEHFEDLILRPARSLRSLAAWLGIPYSDASLHYHRRKDAAEAAELSPLWSNLSSAPMADRVSVHLAEAGNEEFLCSVEELVFDEMARYGYEPLHATSARVLSPEESVAARENDERLREESVRSHSGRDQSAHLLRGRLLQAIRSSLERSEEPGG
ncbi:MULTISPECIES: sulfotransferase [unclassified Streptomyces]|uniref:sulfotransferase family protein n=1 Tax=unclassified Streptomyces TaxID=2593676 RepID=UPI0035DE85E6